MALPKNHIENMKLRNIAIGNERRREVIRGIIDKSVNFPKGVMLKDIDQTFYEWVEKELYITFEGEVLPTYKLFSNQRINEYAQNWSHTDDKGNVLMNFKAISRDNNPKKGNNQGGLWNIPGERDYLMGYVPVLQENGQEAYDMYTMKQPYTLDLEYSVTLITNKYELLNNMNQLVQHKFSALQAYIFPNGHSMPMKLTDVSDESEYNIDDRKYYSQTYKIELLAYIIDPKGFKITHVPSRLKIRTVGVANDLLSKKNEVKVKIEDWNIAETCKEDSDSPYYNQPVNIIIDFPQCRKEVDFIIDSDLIIDTIELDNIYDFTLCVNGEEQLFEIDETRIYNGDSIHIEITRDDLYQDSKITIKCYNPSVIYDERYNPESQLDDNQEEINKVV